MNSKLDGLKFGFYEIHDKVAHEFRALAHFVNNAG